MASSYCFAFSTSPAVNTRYLLISFIASDSFIPESCNSLNAAAPCFPNSFTRSWLRTDASPMPSIASTVCTIASA